MLGAGAHSLLLGCSKPSADLFLRDLVGLSGIRKLKQNRQTHYFQQWSSDSDVRLQAE